MRRIRLQRRTSTALLSAALAATAALVGLASAAPGDLDPAFDSPRITVTDPRGRRYVDDGSPVQGTRSASLLHVDRARRSILTVRGRPPAGIWTIETQPGSPAITGLSTRRDLAQTRVFARVRGRGAGRRLVYRVEPVPGQRVTFFEEGRTVGRRIGVAGATHGALPFPKGHGTAGKRRVFAIVEQNGMPRRRIALTSYVAPAAPRVPAPGACARNCAAPGSS